MEQLETWTSSKWVSPAGGTSTFVAWLLIEDKHHFMRVAD